MRDLQSVTDYLLRIGACYPRESLLITTTNGGMWGAKARFQGVGSVFVAVIKTLACDWSTDNRRHLTTRVCVIDWNRNDFFGRLILILAACAG